MSAMGNAQRALNVDRLTLIYSHQNLLLAIAFADRRGVVIKSGAIFLGAPLSQMSSKGKFGVVRGSL